MHCCALAQTQKLTKYTFNVKLYYTIDELNKKLNLSKLKKSLKFHCFIYYQCTDCKQLFCVYFWTNGSSILFIAHVASQSDLKL